MSHSKGTTNYNLPLFTKDDRPAWLTDFNSAMLGVDAAVKAVADSVEAGGLPVTGGTMQGNIDMGNHAITNVQEVELLGSPTTDNQAATKGYVDNQIKLNITDVINASY